jgi:hypothetical protein
VRAPSTARAARAIAADREPIGRGGELGHVSLAAILDLCSDAHRFEIDELHGTRGEQDLSSALQVLAGSFAKSLRLDQVRDGSHR